MPIAVGVFIGILALILAFVFLHRAPAGWQAFHSLDRTTDELTFDFRLRSSDGDSVLSIWCKPGERIGAILTAGRRLGEVQPGQNPMRRPARVRFDDGQAAPRLVVVGEETIGLTEADDPSSPDIISQLASSRRFAIDVEPPSGRERFVAAFQTTGADDVVSDLRRTCT